LEPPGVLAQSVLVADRTVVGVNPTAVTTDVAAFDAAIASADRERSDLERLQWLGEAVEGYRGELLPGCFEEWVLRERQRLTESYLEALGPELRQRRGIAESLEGLAGIAGAEGQPRRAARLFGAAQAVRDVLCAPRAPHEQAAVERAIQAARATLGESGWREAWTEGQQMPLAEALDDALWQTDPTALPESLDGV
jgi:hypothetical protein